MWQQRHRHGEKNISYKIINLKCIYKFNFRLDDDIVLETDGVIADIAGDNFIDCIGGELEEVIKKNEKALEKKL